MTKQTFITKDFRDEKLTLIREANKVITSYQAQGFTMTLRQLYYQLVTQNIVPNTERSYKRLGETISEGRLAGLIDWDAIEDRTRQPRKPPQFDNLKDLVKAAIQSYRLDRWKGQDSYVELWVEKDALAGVLQPLARDRHVTLMVNRGYSSQSAMYEASTRFLEAADNGKDLVLLYLGDHDPSGEDMVRDVRDRLAMFGAEVTVTKLALTRDQVDQYAPPPNPAKMSDARAAKYVEEHGAESWEVDALPPNVLQDLILEAIDGYLDSDLMDEVKAKEDRDKARLLKAVGAKADAEEDDGAA